jgi:glycosyltransferase involved in cell wall biosynthesis
MNINQSNQNKKIIYFFMPTIEAGGIEKNLLILTDFFCKKNFTVFLFYSRINEIIEKKLNPKIIKKKSKSYIFFNYLNKRIWDSLNCSINLYLNASNNNYGLIFSLQSSIFSIIVSKLKKLKIITRIANHPSSSLSFFNNSLFYQIKINVKTVIYKFSNGIICNSNDSKKFFISKSYKKKLISIYNPLPLRKNKNIYISHKKNNFLLTVARLENQKNIIGLIYAFKIVNKKFDKIKLIIIGSGSEKAIILKKIDELKLKNSIKIINSFNIAKFYINAKIFILNSLWEGLPNVLIEAMSFKVPIISSNCLSGPAELLRKGRYGYLTPVQDDEKLARKIIYVLSNYKKAKKKAFLAYQSLGRFDNFKQCEKYYKFVCSFY